MATCKYCGKEVKNFIKHDGIAWNARKIVAAKKVPYNILWSKRWNLEITYRGDFDNCWYLDTIETYHKLNCADEISCDRLLRLFSGKGSRE